MTVDPVIYRIANRIVVPSDMTTPATAAVKIEILHICIESSAVI